MRWTILISLNIHQIKPFCCFFFIMSQMYRYLRPSMEAYHLIIIPVWAGKQWAAGSFPLGKYTTMCTDHQRTHSFIENLNFYWVFLHCRCTVTSARACCTPTTLTSSARWACGRYIPYGSTCGPALQYVMVYNVIKIFYKSTLDSAL